MRCHRSARLLADQTSSARPINAMREMVALAPGDAWSATCIYLSTRGRLAFSLARWRRPRRVAGTRALPTVRAPRAPIDG